MTVFEFEDYKPYIQQKIREVPGKGPLKRLAEHIQIHGSLLSQILRGDRHFSQEQAFLVTTFFKLDENETEFFMTLVALQRAGTPSLREFYGNQLEKIRTAASEASGPLPDTKVVDKKYRGEFYSNWYYSGIRLLTAIEKFQDPDSIAKYFSLPKTMVNQVLKFLVETGLCVKEGSKYKIGSRFTALEVDSPFFSRHHMNWRVKALEKVTRRSPDEFFLSYPLVLGEKDRQVIKNMLLNTVAEIEKIVEPSPCERLTCLNIDWFDF